MSNPGSGVVVDVHYPSSGGARGAAVACADLRFADVVAEWTVDVAAVAPYQSGEFYRRELPVLEELLSSADEMALLVIDGYVDLAPGRPGLGRYCHETFGVPVIGIAKTAFRGAEHAVPVRRGEASRPIYVTAAGIPKGDAAKLVTDMAGPYRLPDAVRRVDSLARGIAQARDISRGA